MQYRTSLRRNDRCSSLPRLLDDGGAVLGHGQGSKGETTVREQSHSINRRNFIMRGASTAGAAALISPAAAQTSSSAVGNLQLAQAPLGKTAPGGTASDIT